VLVAIFTIALILLLSLFVRRQIAAGLTRVLRERDGLRNALHYVLDSADAPLSEEIRLVITIGESAREDRVRHETVTTPTKPLRYRTFYPVIPDTRKTPSFENMDFTGTLVSPESAGLEILPIRKDRWIRIVALFRPAVDGSCHWIVDYRSPGLWNPLREFGRDTLIWRMWRHPGATEKATTEVTIKFVPPAGTSVTVTEREGRGTATRSSDPTGSKCAIWYVLETRPTDVFVFDLRLVLDD
jgi:hypothetical protein